MGSNIFVLIQVFLLMKHNIYLLKDLAKLSGYSTHALKFYLRLGILKEIGRTPETDFRYFDDSSCERLKQIRQLQKNDMSLKEIRDYFDRCEKELVNERKN